MAINPLSDIVLDVTRAADPQAYRASVEKLQTSRPVYSAASFDVSDPSLSVEKMRPPVAVKEQASLENPHRKFEAFMLQSFIMDMFTSDTNSVFGKGAGADFWKGMLAEKMADEMAQGGGIGIAALMDERAAVNNTQKSASPGTMDEAAASVFVHKNQINFMRSVNRDKPL